MVRENEIRTAEVAIDPPAANDAGLVFIGRIGTPWTSRLETPRQGRPDGPTCRIAKARRMTAPCEEPSHCAPPVRPNPIGASIVQLIGVKGNVILVRGLDCLDGTPLLDLKPGRTLFTPIAPPQKGDCQVGDP